MSDPRAEENIYLWMFPGETLECHCNLVLEDKGSESPQLESFWRQQLLREMHLPSRSFSGVSAVYQSEGGPVPFTVMAATWKLYWLPFSSPGKQTNKTSEIVQKEEENQTICDFTQRSPRRPPLCLPARLGMVLQGTGGGTRDFGQKERFQKMNESRTGP